MALQKQNLNINFAQGLDTKTDPKQISPGKFLSLQNSIFDTAGLLKKRNGFGSLPSLPDSSSFYATTFGGNLLALGDKINVLSTSTNKWVEKGPLKSIALSTKSLVKSGTNQTECDAAIAPNGLVCTVYIDSLPTGDVRKYSISDAETGENIISPTIIPVASGTVLGTPRVFVLNRYFIIVFDNLISAVHHLSYIAISIADPTVVIPVSSLTSNYTPSGNVNFDAAVANNSLYFAWNGNDGGGAIRMTFITSTLSQGNTVVFSGHAATVMNVTADLTQSVPVIYASFYNFPTTSGFVLAVNPALVTVLAPTQIISSGQIDNITASAQNQILNVFYEVAHSYSYDSGIATNFILQNTVTQSGTVGSPTTLLRSVGLASKSFIYNGIIYVLVTYSSSTQPTYFLTDNSSNIIARLAYSNGGGGVTQGLPSVNVNGSVASMSYLFKDLVEAVNKSQGAPSSAGVYAQTGINLVNFDLGKNTLTSAEIGSNLNITGGLMWAYDGNVAVEQGFNVWPDYIEATWSATGGSMHAQPDGATNTNAYFYQITYEWSDNQGNIFRSAPSIPIGVTTTGSGTTGSITVNIPTLRLTYKIANPVKIVVYRWSVAQQEYFQVTSVATPTLNDPTVDSIAYVDTLADASIIGNNLIYTTGGVIENIAPPAIVDVSLFKSRLFYIEAEDRNVLGYSKQVIEATPVETNDLFTIYVAPTTGAQGSTGDLNFSYPMDDKLCLFKDNAIYYITGNGPDNTGANNDLSDPIFITSVVGSNNKASVVLIPQGLMFQSNKGIWLLGRDLSTQYIGAPVEGFNSYTITSAVNVPATNQVRFTLSNGTMLMYDYFFNQWGQFVGAKAISSTLYLETHTLINSFGQVFQETPGAYLDGTSPVLVGFTTGWFNLAGLQGYERAYFFTLLASFVSPHKLLVQIAYDYAPFPSQSLIITPDNYSAPYGGDPTYGFSTPYGGPGLLEQWKIFFENQLCQSFQIILTEVFDPSFGAQAGAGFTASGLDFVFGIKKGYRPFAANKQVG